MRDNRLITIHFNLNNKSIHPWKTWNGSVASVEDNGRKEVCPSISMGTKSSNEDNLHLYTSWLN